MTKYVDQLMVSANLAAGTQNQLEGPFLYSRAQVIVTGSKQARLFCGLMKEEFNT